MAAPNLVLRGERGSSAADYSAHFAITSHVELTTKPSYNRPFTMLATRLRLDWWWINGEWHHHWSISGHRYRKTKNDWSPHEQGYMNDMHIDLPEWVLPLIEANAPTMQPTTEGRGR